MYFLRHVFDFVTDITKIRKIPDISYLDIKINIYIMKHIKSYNLFLNSVDEGKIANIAAGVGLAAGSLFGGEDAISQNRFKDKIENLGDKLASLKADAGEELARLKQTALSLKDKDELKNIGSANYSFDEIKKEFEEESKKGDIQYGVGKSKDQGFSWEEAYADAADRYMKKKGLSEFRNRLVQIKHHTFQNKDGSYVTIALFRF